MPTVLVIDDENGILQLIRQALTSFGHNVETATDGQEGIRKFDDGSFDIVITDIRMPGIDGNGVVDHIRKSEKQSVPVIAISGTATGFRISQLQVWIVFQISGYDLRHRCRRYQACECL